MRAAPKALGIKAVLRSCVAPERSGKSFGNKGGPEVPARRWTRLVETGPRGSVFTFGKSFGNKGGPEVLRGAWGVLAKALGIKAVLRSPGVRRHGGSVCAPRQKLWE